MDEYSGTSTDGLAAHYETGTDFFKLWLGETLIYSCAKHDNPSATLEDAQFAKVDYFASRLGIASGSRVVDVGCGWGGTAKRLAEEHGALVTGLTLSPAHREYIEAFSVPGRSVELANWFDYRPPEPLDAVVCFDAMEHFARDDATREEKIKIYDTFFGQTADWLRPDGRFGLQVLCFDNVGEDRASFGAGPVATLMRQEVFPEAMPPHLSEIVVGWEPHYEILTLEADPEAYAKTFREWLYRLRRSEVEAEHLVGHEVYRRYWRYLAALVAMYRLHEWTLYRIVLQRRRRTKS